METKPDYQTDRKEPPNFRDATCCEHCKLASYTSYSIMVMNCNKYDGRVSCTHVCDDYEPDN